MLRNSKISHATTPLAPLRDPTTNALINPFPQHIQGLESLGKEESIHLYLLVSELTLLLDRTALIALLTSLGAIPAMHQRRRTQLLRAARVELGLSEA
jgi:hypothetical protein